MRNTFLFRKKRKGGKKKNWSKSRHRCTVDEKKNVVIFFSRDSKSRGKKKVQGRGKKKKKRVIKLREDGVRATNEGTKNAGRSRNVNNICQITIANAQKTPNALRFFFFLKYLAPRAKLAGPLINATLYFLCFLFLSVYLTILCSPLCSYALLTCPQPTT